MADESSVLQANRRRWRRLHTLSGGLVLGAFVVEHLLTNASALGGQAGYDAVVGSILHLRVLPVFEVLFIVVPLLFHAGYGVVLLRSHTTPEAEMERYGDRRLWIIQRISAVFVALFVLVHLWELRLQRLIFGLPEDALYTTLTAHLSWTWGGLPWIAFGYLAGIALVLFHFANGLYAATDAWGIAVDPAGRRRVRIATVALAVALFVVGAATVIGLATGTRLWGEDDSAPAAPCGSAVVPAPSLYRAPPIPSR